MRGCKPTPVMMKEGGTISKWSCNCWKDIQLTTYHYRHYNVAKKFTNDHKSKSMIDHLMHEVVSESQEHGDEGSIISIK